ncbi:MAG: hypothetical protein Q4C19_10765 [Clostridiaceae bacterium]|nr:hypothetical protein [Clostridiaceae bacterium]
MKEQKKQITLRIPEVLCDYCTKIAKERQWRRSDVISDYIKMGIEQEKEYIREGIKECFEKHDNRHEQFQAYRSFLEQLFNEEVR